MFKGFRKRFTTHRHSGRGLRRVPGLNTGCDVISVHREPPDKGGLKTTSPRQVHPSEQSQPVPYNGCPDKETTYTDTGSTLKADLDPNFNTKTGSSMFPTGMEDPSARDLIERPVNPLVYLNNTRGYPTTPNLVIKRGKVELKGQGDALPLLECRNTFEHQQNLRNILPPENTFRRHRFNAPPTIGGHTANVDNNHGDDTLKEDKAALDQLCDISSLSTSQHSDQKPAYCSTALCSSTTLPSHYSQPSDHQTWKTSSTNEWECHTQQFKEMKRPAAVSCSVGEPQTPVRHHHSYLRRSSDDGPEEGDDDKRQSGKMSFKRRAPLPPHDGKLQPALTNGHHQTTTSNGHHAFTNGSAKGPEEHSSPGRPSWAAQGSFASVQETAIVSGQGLDDALQTPPNMPPEYYERYAQVMQILHLNIENKNQRRQLEALNVVNRELAAGLRAQHDTFAASLDSIMAALVAGIIDKEQLRGMVIDLQKKMSELKQRNDLLQHTSPTSPGGDRFCSLPHTAPHHQLAAAGLKPGTGSLPHSRQRRHFHPTALSNGAGVISVLRNGSALTTESSSTRSGGVNSQKLPFSIQQRMLQFNVTTDFGHHNQPMTGSTCEAGTKAAIGDRRSPGGVPVGGRGLQSTTSMPELFAGAGGTGTASARGDEGYWTMGSNAAAVTDSRSTLPRASRVSSSFRHSESSSVAAAAAASSTTSAATGTVTEESRLLNGVTLPVVDNKFDNRGLYFGGQGDNITPNVSVTSAHTSMAFNTSSKWSTVPRFSTPCQGKSSMPPSRTHQSISLSGSKYISPMACDGLVRIISDMMNEIYVSFLPGRNSVTPHTLRSLRKFPIRLSFVSSPEEAKLGLARGVYHLNYEACDNGKCSVCTDMLQQGASIFEVYWPCPEGRKLQLIQMTRTCPGAHTAECGATCAVPEVVGSSNDNSSCSQTTNRSVVTQIANVDSDPPSTYASDMSNCDTVEGSKCHQRNSRGSQGTTGTATRNSMDVTSTASFRTDSEASVCPTLQSGCDPEFVQPELEWYGGSFQQPDNDWPQVHELLMPAMPSRDSPRSGCSDQLAMYPNDLSCGSLKGNLSSNSSRITDLDNLTDRLSDRFFDFRTGSCPDLTSDGCSDLLMPEGDMVSLESCSEGDLMSIDNRYLETSSTAYYYSIANVDVDMFSPTQQTQPGALPSLQSLCYPPMSSTRNSCSSPISPLPPHPEISCSPEVPPIEAFPDPPFPEPPSEDHLHDALEQVLQDCCGTEELPGEIYGTVATSPPPPPCLPYPNKRQTSSSKLTATEDYPAKDSPDGAAPSRTPVPSVPPHLVPVDSPSIPKRVTSRPLPSLPPGGAPQPATTQQPMLSPQLSDYTIPEYIESPDSPPPVLPVRKITSSITNTNLSNGNSRNIPHSCNTAPFSSSHSSSIASNSHTSSTVPPYSNGSFPQPTSNTMTSLRNSPALPNSSDMPNLPHIMRVPIPPPRAPRRSTSLLAPGNRPVSTIDFPLHSLRDEETDTNDNKSEGGGVYGSLSNGSSPLEGLESSWVRLNSETLASCSTTGAYSPSSGDDSSSLPTGSGSRRGQDKKSRKKGRHQGNCITSIQ